MESTDPPGAVERVNDLLHFVGTEGAVFVVEAVTRAVGRGDVKLHEVNVLAEDVGRRAHLEVVDEVIIGHEVRVPVFDDVAGVAAEEERLGRASGTAGRESHGGLHVVPQRQDALLRVVPAELVKPDVELDRGRFVNSFALLIGSRIDVDGLAVIVDCRIGKRRAGLWTKRQTVQHETGRPRVLRHLRRRRRSRRTAPGSAIREEARTAAHSEKLHRDFFNVRSRLGKLVRGQRREVFAPVKLIVFLV